MVITAELPKDRTTYCTLYLVRHGETEMNISGLFQGHVDSPLTENGVKQAEELCEILRHIHFDTIFSSDLARAHRTAEILTVDRQLAIKTSHLLREMYGGEYEGKNFHGWLEDLQALLEKLGELTEGERLKVKIGNGESEEDVAKRLTTILREIAVGYPVKNALVVTHGGAIRILLIHLGWATRGQLPPKSFSNCGYVKLLCNGVDFFVEEVVGATLKQ